MAEEKEPEKVEPTPEKKKSPILLIIVILILVLILAGGAVAGYFLFIAPKSASSQTAQKNQADPKAAASQAEQSGSREGGPSGGPMKLLDPFIVNLSDAEGSRYLKVVMQLEANNDFVGPEIEKKLPEVRDEIIMTLSSKSYDDVSTVGGKKALKHALVNGVNKYLTTGQVVRVYFTEFVVQ